MSNPTAKDFLYIAPPLPDVIPPLPRLYRGDIIVVQQTNKFGAFKRSDVYEMLLIRDKPKRYCLGYKPVRVVSLATGRRSTIMIDYDHVIVLGHRYGGLPITNGGRIFPVDHKRQHKSNTANRRRGRKERINCKR